MFNLEQSIETWRQQMQTAGIHTPEVLDELESHLREETERQIRSGAGAQEAFASAARQIGSARALKAEFEKVRFFTPALLRKLGMAAYLTELGGYTWMQWRYLGQAYPTRQDLVLGAIGLATTLALAYAIWVLAVRLMGRITSKVSRSWIAIAGCISPVLWLIVFARGVLPRIELNTGQLAVTFIWAMIPLITLPAILAGVDQSEREFAK